MAKIIYRPTSGAAAKLRQQARRLGEKLVRRGGGVMNELHDGFILRAVAKGDVVRVTAIDPPAAWLFCDRRGETNAFPHLARHLTRGDLLPTLDPPAPPEVLTITDENVLLTVPSGFASTGDIPTPYGADSGQTNWNSGYVMATERSMDRQTADENASYMVYARAINGRTPINKLATPRLDAQMNYLFTDAFFQQWTGDALFTFRPHISDSLVVSAPRIVTDDSDGLEYEEVVIAVSYSRYDKQKSAEKGWDVLEHGWMVGLFRARHAVPEGEGDVLNRWLLPRWGIFVPASQNPNPDLRPVPDPLDGSLWQGHVVADVGMVDADDRLVAVVSSVRRADAGAYTYTDTMGTQLVRINRQTGQYSVTTIAKASATYQLTLTGYGGYILTGAASLPFILSLNRLEYRRPAQDGEETVTALACVQFTASAAAGEAGTIIQPDTIQLVFFTTTGDQLTTGLGAAGYAPFWPRLSWAYSPWGHKDNLGYSSAPQHCVAQYLGNGLIGVVAAPRSQAGTRFAEIDWQLVVLRASDLSFVESRGLIGTLLEHNRTCVCFTVVQPEAENSPAVLMAWVYAYYEEPVSQYKLSRDGGRTWKTVMAGAMGPAFYLGNSLRDISICSGL